MFCKKCGAELAEDARFCTVCGCDQQSDTSRLSEPLPGSKPDNYLWLGVLVTVLCCLPFGIVSIVNSAKVDSLWAAGETEEARKYSAKAKTWAFWAIGLSVVFWILYIILLAVIWIFALDIGDFSPFGTYDCKFI